MSERARSEESPPTNENLESRAHRAIVEWLTREHPQPGQSVPVREFARRLNMSRTPVRSAVGRLYERGLLAHDPVAGFTVAIPSLSSLYELFELRLMIESHSLRLFGGRGDREVSPVLGELVKEAQQLAPVVIEDPTRYFEFRDNDQRFHRELVKLGGLPRLLALHDDLHLSIHVTWAGMEAPLTRDRLDSAVREHADIVTALEVDDWETARADLESHILRVRDQTIVFLSRPRM